MDYENQGLLHEQFIRQAHKTPDAVAVVSPEENETVTFHHLDKWTDVLAAHLQAIGVTPNSCVGIYLGKTVNFVVSYIAILKAGGGYLPFDTSYPSHMLDSIITDAKPVALITIPELAPELQACPSINTTTVVLLESGWQDKMEAKNTPNSKPVPAKMTLDNLAYAVYSSGTTGVPKGIMCPHRGAVFSYHHRHTHYPYGPDEKEACNIFFVWEMLRPLLKGVTLYVMPNYIVYDPARVCEFLRTHQITRMLFTPSLLETIMNTTPIKKLQESFKSMRHIWFCGEVVTTSLLERCIESLPWVRFINLYSISESHDVACQDLSQYYEDNKETLLSRKYCPVGHVLKGVDIVIIEKGKVQPVGVSGEIFVGGPTLAIGYINRPDVQAKRFITFQKSERLYVTGDWGYMLSDGRLEICGRIDSMVKVRGYSIEIQAVEACLLSLPMIKACVVLVKGEEGENKFLVAYIVPAKDTSKKEVRAELKKMLPFYMIPSYFLFLESIPVLPASGKLDKKALPSYDSQTEDIGAEGRPSTVTEIALAEIWIEVLGLKEVDIQESFFDLGGHSLVASEILQRAATKFHVQLSVRELFLHPTIAGLAKLIDARVSNTNGQNEGQDDLQPTLDLSNEVTRHDQGVGNFDMQLRAFWRMFHHGHHFRRGRVLLTGATGFLGSFLLRDLLIHTELVVYCLVREVPQVSPLERLQTTLSKFGVVSGDESTDDERQAEIRQALKKRVRAVIGNVSLIKMGLNEEDYTYLCTDIDFIIHAAAAVNLAYPYSALHGSNVLGTANVIQFAVNGKIKALHYISTDSVFPDGLKDCKEDTDLTQFAKVLTNGYSQSKWVAEQLVTKARARGLPVTTYRLGNLSGDSRFAHWNPQDFTLMMLQSCVFTGAAPDIDWRMEMTPVDFVSEFIVQLSQHPNDFLGKTFHVVNDNPMKVTQIFRTMHSHGHGIKLLPFDEWKKRVIEELPKSSGLCHPSQETFARVLDGYASTAEALTKLTTYDTTNFRQAMAAIQTKYPYTDERLLNVYSTELSKRGLIGRKKVEQIFSAASTNLTNCVAVVTGASSGIGVAVARALAGAGAKVALAARGIDSLERHVQSIRHEGGRAMAIKTDVTDRDQVKSLISLTEAELGPVNILVNCAGVMYYTMMKNLHEDEWERQIDVNCKGVVNGIGAVLSGMIKRGQGHIVNMSSNAGRKSFAGLAVYSGTKFFVEGVSQALRQEVAGTGVKVTCIQPGDVRTPLLTKSTDTEAVDKYDGSGNMEILGPEDIGKAVVFAVSQPSYVAINEILVEPREAPA